MPVVDLGYAQYQGSYNASSNTTSFLGIRYAAPPTGQLRWAAPSAPATMSGIQMATEQPSECYQAPAGIAAVNPLRNNSMWKRSVTTSEDCLFLNVYVPGGQILPLTVGGLPVVVWIHGGGYIEGAASMYNGADLIVDSDHRVIVVVIQYRLGLFGFLPGEAVKQGGALNAGLLDQNYALQWVQSHIATFGGDPTQVTIWGESAGAGSVLQHLVAHGGNTQPPLFRAAMTSSTFLPSQYNYNDSIPELLYNEVLNGTGCGSDSDTLSCLRNADVSALQTVNYNINLAGFYGTFVFVPVVDGTFIIERPTVTIAKGRLNAEVLLAVTNVNEGTIFVNQSMTLNTSEYILQLFPKLQPWQAALALPLYEPLGTNVEQANLIMGESIFVCPTYYLLEAFRGKSWKGEFAVPPALHGYDVPYYFTSFGTPYNNSQFITAFSNGFMALAVSLNPNAKYNASDITPTWDQWDSGHTEMIFNKTVAGVPDIYAYPTDDAVLDRCRYWHSVAAWTAQ
ncbi:Alpha/Beta hydrolase protein [Phlebopus sp. FC_14]|nr:Alpha/Beta hydrolase protein [Phlebopus sp. FC_14]